MHVDLIRRLPRTDDLGDLPVRARLAFAMRCAARCRSLLGSGNSCDAVRALVDSALRWTEQQVNTKLCGEPGDDPRPALRRCLREGVPSCHNPGFFIVSAAYGTADAACRCDRENHAGRSAYTTFRVACVVRDTFYAALAGQISSGGADWNYLHELVTAINDDLDEVSAEATRESWQDHLVASIAGRPAAWCFSAGPARGGSCHGRSHAAL